MPNFTCDYFTVCLCKECEFTMDIYHLESRCNLKKVHSSTSKGVWTLAMGIYQRGETVAKAGTDSRKRRSAFKGHQIDAYNFLWFTVSPCSISP